MFPFSIHYSFRRLHWFLDRKKTSSFHTDRTCAPQYFILPVYHVMENLHEHQCILNALVTLLNHVIGEVCADDAGGPAFLSSWAVFTCSHSSGRLAQSPEGVRPDMSTAQQLIQVTRGICRGAYWSFQCIFQVFPMPGASPASTHQHSVTITVSARCFTATFSIVSWVARRRMLSLSNSGLPVLSVWLFFHFSQATLCLKIFWYKTKTE